VRETEWRLLRPLAKPWHPVWWAVVGERRAVGGGSAVVVAEGGPRLEAGG